MWTTPTQQKYFKLVITACGVALQGDTTTQLNCSLKGNDLYLIMYCVYKYVADHLKVDSYFMSTLLPHWLRFFRELKGQQDYVHVHNVQCILAETMPYNTGITAQKWYEHISMCKEMAAHHKHIGVAVLHQRASECEESPPQCAPLAHTSPRQPARKVNTALHTTIMRYLLRFPVSRNGHLCPRLWESKLQAIQTPRAFQANTCGWLQSKNGFIQLVGHLTLLLLSSLVGHLTTH